MHVRTDIKAGAAPTNLTEQQLQDAIQAIRSGVKSANELFNPFTLADILTGAQSGQ